MKPVTTRMGAIFELAVEKEKVTVVSEKSLVKGWNTSRFVLKCWKSVKRLSVPACYVEPVGRRRQRSVYWELEFGSHG